MQKVSQCKLFSNFFFALHFVKERAAYQFQRLHNPASVQLEPAPRTTREASRQLTYRFCTFATASYAAAAASGAAAALAANAAA